MYASIRQYRGNSALAEQLAARSDEVKSLISAVQGFQAYYLVSAGDDTASITVCDDQAGAEESNRVAAEWLRENMPDAGTAAPQVTAGSVVLQA